VFASALAKARGHALRLATVLEHLWWCGTPHAHEPSVISGEAVTAAAALIDSYFVPPPRTPPHAAETLTERPYPGCWRT
jgi:hypothetical protein